MSRRRNTPQEPRSKAPAERWDLDIIGVQQAGMGVAKAAGEVVFVLDALPGERVCVELDRTHGKVPIGTVVHRNTTNPQRQSPRCSVFGQCGGCVWQHFAYAEQAIWKRQFIVNALQRIGGVRTCDLGDDERSDACVVHPTVTMDDPWAYRNNVQVVVAPEGAHVQFGFYAHGTYRVVDPEQCHIAHPHIDACIQAIAPIVRSLSPAQAYDRRTHRGWLRHVLIRASEANGTVMVMLVVTATGAHTTDLVRTFVEALRTVDHVCSIALNVHDTATSRHFGTRTVHLWGKTTIEDRIDGLTFSISPLSFFQVNTRQTEALYACIQRVGNVTEQDVVCDLYCGIGTISLYLARYARQVIAVDTVADAIADARNNAHRNRIDNVTFYHGDAATYVPRWYEEGVRPSVIVVDPPRQGCAVAVIETIVRMAPARVVYVSCHAATMARDVQRLQAGGYRVVEAHPVDMFPQTEHVECVVGLRKIK